ncbi:PREDICTED: ankyrin repeat domain-containing protein 40 [Charadrius vociferus]|uniref:ankyrin repeat domain-containing protein 40 n=1 Tax=Charadrius vociferus TaxID=50402 RepID=UPI0005216849|nr:PREDICTED: ankyrin repeat domain-containing protein 40 [Charadrius vociferus]
MVLKVSSNRYGSVRAPTGEETPPPGNNAAEKHPMGMWLGARDAGCHAASWGDMALGRGHGAGTRPRRTVQGGTCLHWACKRNHAPVVAFLLHAGADKEILTKKGERPSQLTSKREIRKMLGVEDDEMSDLAKDSDLPIIPNYLANPPFPYVYNTMSDSIPDPAMNGSISHLEPQDTNSSSLPDAGSCPRAALQRGNAALEAAGRGGVPSLPRGCTAPPRSTPVLQGGPLYQGAVSWSRSPPSPSLAGSNQSVPQQENGSCMGPVPAFQPVFFTGAFPLNMQELVLKVRIQNPNLRENDFIEIELDRQELTYKELLRVSCHELGVNPEHVQKIRKLPNTMLRKDKDVARLQDFQELELVLTVSDKNLLFRVPTLSERSGYNKKASELTY